MLLDEAAQIVRHAGCHHQSILGLAVHCLGIDVIHVHLVLHQPSFLLELGEVLGRLGIHSFIILARSNREIYFGLNDVIERLFIVASLGTGLFAVQHVIGTALYQFHQFLGRTQSPERFYNCHSLTIF